MPKCWFTVLSIVASAVAFTGAHAQFAENFVAWPVLKSTFPSTGGGGIMIKGYDPVITGRKCVTTFMAVEPGDAPKVYAGYVEFEVVEADGGTLCTNGKWKMMDGSNSGTTPFRVFFKDGVFRGQ